MSGLSAPVKRGILIAAVACLAAAFLALGLVAFGEIRPEPTLDVIRILAGGVALAALAFGAARRGRA